MFLLKLLFKNAFRHKLRGWLTILTITIAILAFGLLRTVMEAWYVGVERSSANRIVTRNAVSMTFSLPLSYKEKIAQVAGVNEVSAGNWFGGVYIDEKNFFPNFAVEPITYFAFYPEYVLRSRSSRRPISTTGRALSREGSSRTGSGGRSAIPITFRGTIYPGNWQFMIRAIYTEGTRTWTRASSSSTGTTSTRASSRPRQGRADQVGAYIVGIDRAETRPTWPPPWMRPSRTPWPRHSRRRRRPLSSASSPWPRPSS